MRQQEEWRRIDKEERKKEKSDSEQGHMQNVRVKERESG